MSQPDNLPETGELLQGSTADDDRSRRHSGGSGRSPHSASGSGRHHSSHDSSGGEHSSHGSSGGEHFSHGSSGSEHSSHGSSGSEHSSHGSSGSEHSSHGSSGGEHSSHGSSGSGHSSHGSSGGGHSSSHHASHSSRQNAEREHREALIGKYQVVSQDEIASEETHSHRHRHHHRHRSRRRTIRRILIAAASVFLALILIAAGSFAVLHRIGKKQVLAEPVGIQMNPSFSVSYDEGNTVEYNGGIYELNRSLVTIAAIGVDRESFGLQDDKIGTAGQADMILLLALDLDTGSVRGILIPRDTMVDVDLYTVDGQYVGVDNMQVCLSFAYGDGAQTSAANVLTSVGRILYGMPLHLFGAMDLDGIAALNDAIGGVTVTLQDDYDGAAAGQQITLHGMDAHTFVRARDTESLNSDAARRVRQMQYLRAFVDKAANAARADIGVIRRLYNVAMQYAFTNMSLPKVTYLASTLLSKGAVMGEIVTLQGELRDADPYPEYHLDEKAVFETVLDVFYTRVN